MATISSPEGGWLGLMIRTAQESKNEDEFDEKLAKQLEAHGADGEIWDLLARYGWTDANRMAFCAPTYRMSVERGFMLKERK